MLLQMEVEILFEAAVLVTDGTHVHPRLPPAELGGAHLQGRQAGTSRPDLDSSALIRSGLVDFNWRALCGCRR